MMILSTIIIHNNTERSPVDALLGAFARDVAAPGNGGAEKRREHSGMSIVGKYWLGWPQWKGFKETELSFRSGVSQ